MTVTQRQAGVTRSVSALVLLLFVGVGVMAQQSLKPEDLPYQRATGVTDATGKRVLQHWSNTDDLLPEMTERYLPDDPAFAGAEVWNLSVSATSIAQAAEKAFARAGMTDVVLLAQRAGNPLAVQSAASDPRARMTAVMVSGRLKGASAKGIGYVFHSDADDEPSVSAFMAPSPVFVALGGHIIPEVHWYLGTTDDGHDLIAEGRLQPQEAVDEASAFFSLWVSAYVAPLKGIQQQTLQSMQSWNNAINVCTGDPSCTVAPMNDGSGNWEAVIRDGN